jgi:hypothetical protein
MGEPEMSYVLIISIISTYGAVNTQRLPGFDNYQSCASFAVDWAESQRPLHPDEQLKWECQRSDGAH